MVDQRLTLCGRATHFSLTPVSSGGTLTYHKSPTTTIGELNDLRR